MGIYKCGVFFLKIKLSFAHITIKVQSFNYALNPRFGWGAHMISSKEKKKGIWRGCVVPRFPICEILYCTNY